MNPKHASIIGAAAAMVAGPALAAAPPAEPAVPHAASYAELLQPIPNAVERLKVSDAELDGRPAVLIPARYYRHHHHHHHSRRWYMSRGYSWYNGGWVLRPRYHHHHHHHHRDRY